MVTLPAIDMICQSEVLLPEPSIQGLQTLERRLQKLIAEGKTKFLRRDYQGAEVEYRKVLKAALAIGNKGLSAVASAMIGAALRNQDKLQESKDYYIQATEANPSLFEAWAARGVVSFNLEDYPDAVLSCNRALALKPDEPDLWLLKGYALAKQSHIDAALQALVGGLKLNPGDADGWLIHARLLTEQSKYDESLDSFEQAFALRKRLSKQLHEPLYYLYALALLARGVEVKRKGSLNRVQGLMAKLRRLQIQGRIEGRARAVRKAIKDFKDSYPQHRKPFNALMAMLQDPWVGWQAASYIIGEHWPKGLSVVEAVKQARE